ncbi:phosphotriesterase-related protein [Kaistia hirudinis]|uniref:Phosphotriesterase-related protein n=1 Tax=Kaistia hirudinis TaxID=1293440 RepID=A0A840AUP1_9HYPH|nr:phosphotriesterase [Kaistia hirudinis]MBB3933402.1 phosphotriesterase-related protein [Kaistia hirudinis]
MSELSETHVGSGKVMTVLGPIAAEDLGVTLMHEHILNDCTCWWHKPKEKERRFLADSPVTIDLIGELRMDPFVNLDNVKLNDERLAIEELKPVAALGGRTVVDPTCGTIGRDPKALQRISQGAGLNIVMGAGFYLETSMPPEVSGMSKTDIADRIVGEALEGVDGTGAKVGIIGEIGVSADFTENERKSLRGAAIAQKRTGLPLMVHLPGWFRRAGEVLDMVEEEGGDISHTVLCHMNPSWYDTDYQLGLAARGAFLEYDMVGMDFWYADQGVQCPSDDENARGIKALIDAGFGDRVLVSQDVFLKIMLTNYGGFGYAYIQKHFLPRLKRHGVTDPQVQALMVDNPRRVFFAGA